MLDIVFIMLIFFIVTTSFVKEVGLEVNRPSNAPQEEKKISEVIAIRIDVERADPGQQPSRGHPRRARQRRE